MGSTPITKAVSTWSLHRTLGNFVAEDSAVAGGKFMSLPPLKGGLTLLELIPELAKRDFTTLQIVHFHLESRETGYIERVRHTLDEHGITLDMLLIDDGDLAADNTEKQLEWYDGWLNIAEMLRATCARICAGRQTPTPERLKASGKHLAKLAHDHPDVRIVTENWMEMIPDAESLLTVLDAAGDDVGLLIDLGNWTGDDKYEKLAKIAHLAESCHAKCSFDENGPDEDDFRKALNVLKDADYNGPLALIYDGPDDDEWAALETEYRIASEVLG